MSSVFQREDDKPREKYDIKGSSVDRSCGKPYWQKPIFENGPM